jgi:hypothetical protein
MQSVLLLPDSFRFYDFDLSVASRRQSMTPPPENALLMFRGTQDEVPLGGCPVLRWLLLVSSVAFHHDSIADSPKALD